MIGMSVGKIIIEETMTIFRPNRVDNQWLEIFMRNFRVCSLQIWCDFDRASSLICGNKMPTRCNRGFYCRSYSLLYMFRAPLCPSSGAQEYYTVVAACGISSCGFQVVGLVWSWGLCVRFARCCNFHILTMMHGQNHIKSLFDSFFGGVHKGYFCLSSNIDRHFAESCWECTTCCKYSYTRDPHKCVNWTLQISYMSA